ncbi:MAG TPA: SPOR domain-containing protein [Blastocatellia bacterium]|nr:SPOR domain-containing protein [Blastocatellia bacterium]
MKTPDSPLDLDSLLEPSVDEAPRTPVQPLPPPPPVTMTPTLQEPLAESRWDGDEILDIPRAAATSEAQPDPLAVEDLLAPPPPQSHSYASSYAAPAEPLFSESAPVLETASSNESLWGTSGEEVAPGNVQAGETAYTSSEYAKEPYAEVSATQETPPAPSVFAQDSYTRSPSNTYVVATPDGGNKGRLAKIFLATAVLFALLGVGYFALSGLLKDWFGARNNQQAANQGTAGQTGAATTGKPGVAPSVVPSQGMKPGTEGKNPTASPQASAAASASAKPAATAASTAAPSPTAANQNATKATPTPPPPGNAGHMVGSGDGSLTIQVAAYRTPTEAQQAAAKLKSAGVEARVIKADVPGKGTYYRVQSGRFTNEAEASKYAGELRAKGAIRDFIVAGYQAQ